MKVNYNVSAGIANNALQRNDKKLSESLAKLSSGLKITHAKDNPSGLAMARRMNSQIEGLGVAGDTTQDAISIVQVADGSLSEIQEVLQRMNQLAVQASNGTLTEDDRQVIQAEIKQLKDEVERMASTTQFNGQNLLDGSFDYRGYATVGDDFESSVTNPKISVTTYSDVVEAGKYQIKGINVTCTESTSTTGETKKELQLNSSGITIEKLLDNGTTQAYMTEGMQATVKEDILTLTDIQGNEIKVQLKLDSGESFSSTLNLDLTGTGGMTMQIGANEGQTLDIRIPKVSLATLGISYLDVTTFTNSVTGESEEEGASARAAIDSIKLALSEISSIRSRLGAYQNRLEHTSSNLDVTVENMTSAYSRIMDVDMAEEMTVYSTQQVLSQAGISMMAQANERPSTVLQLLQ